MKNHSKNFKLIKEWINSQYRDIGFYNMPIPLENSLDKSSCIKIMQERLFGYDSGENYSIKSIPEYLKSDSEVAILAIELYSNNIFEISQSLMSSVDFHELLIQNTNINYVYIFGHSPSSISGNKEFVYKIISHYPSIYKHLSDDLFSDKEILLKVLKKRVFPDRLPLVFSNDKKIVLKLINVISYNQKKGSCWENISYLLTFISKELLNNRDVLIEIYSSIKFCSLKIPDSLKTDEEVVINAVKSYPSHYESLNNNLMSHPKIACEAFKGDKKLFLKYFGKHKIEYSSILEFVESLTKPNRRALNYEDSPKIFEDIVDKLIENKLFVDEIAIHLVSIWPRSINFYKYFKTLNPELKKERSIISLLLNHSVSEDDLSFHSHRKGFKDYITSQNVYENYVLPHHPNDKDLILESFYSAPSIFPNIPNILISNEEIILKTSRLISNEKRNEFLATLPESYSSSKSFILKLLEKNISIDIEDCVFNFASDVLRDDDAFVKEAIKIQPQSIQYSSERIKNDIEFQKHAFRMFRKVRKVLRLKTIKAFRKHNMPYMYGKTDEVLDFEFFVKNCKNLMDNKKFILKYNINLKPWKVWEPWEKIKNYWRNKFQLTEICVDENEHIIIFKKNDIFILLAYLHYSSNPSRFLTDTIGDRIDFIKDISNTNYSPFKIFLLCNSSLSIVKESSEILSLPNDVEYYYVDYNWTFDELEIIQENPASFV